MVSQYPIYNIASNSKQPCKFSKSPVPQQGRWVGSPAFAASLELKPVEDCDNLFNINNLLVPALGTDKVLRNTSVNGRHCFFKANRAFKLALLVGDLDFKLVELLVAVLSGVRKVSNLLLGNPDLLKSILPLILKSCLPSLSPVDDSCLMPHPSLPLLHDL